MTIAAEQQLIKLVWEFFGPESLETAQHHRIHLDQFVSKEELNAHGSGVDENGQNASAAFLIVERKDMIKVRDALRPHRAFIVD